MIDPKFPLATLIFTVLMIVASGRCPNGCAGHGTCSVEAVCECFSGWNGGAADCSQRECPSGVAWADKAYDTDVAHGTAECSNVGVCDRSKGICLCSEGFTGASCQRKKCPNSCSGHGVCQSISDLAIFEGPDYETTLVNSGDGLGIAYTLWDKDSTQACKCDLGYFGADCSLVMCPKGDDPYTAGQNYRKIRMSLQTSIAFSLLGSFVLQWEGVKVELQLFPRLSSSECTRLLSAFGSIQCTTTVVSVELMHFDMEFLSFPLYPQQNNLHHHDGNPSIYDFTCDTSNALPTTACVFTDVEADNIREYAMCSNRGTCDFKTGQCKCIPGLGGPACSNSTFLYSHDSTSLPGLELTVQGLDYTSSVIQINAVREKSENFNLIEAIAGTEEMFSVRGDGLVTVHKMNTLSGGQTIAGGGMRILSGGCTIVNAGLNVLSDSTSTPVVTLESDYPGDLTQDYTVLDIISRSSSTSSYYLIRARSEGDDKFLVRADGRVFVQAGGMTITGGLTIHNEGLTVTGGMTVFSGVSNIVGGLKVTGGISVSTGGLRVALGGSQVFAGGMSIYSGGMRITGGLTILSGGLTITSGAAVHSGGMRITGGLTVYSRGLNVADGGISVINDGLTVNDGMTVGSDGVKVLVGGMTIESGGLEVTAGGISVFGGGLTLTGGLTVNAGGLTVTDGITVLTGGIAITGGMTVNSGGVSVSGGLTVTAAGLRITGGMTINSGNVNIKAGAVITGGLTVSSAGLRVTSGGQTVQGTGYISGDVTIAQGLTVRNGILVEGGGLTVFGTTNLQTAAVVFSDRNLKRNLAPIQGALNKVSRLKGVYFNWRQDEETSAVEGLDNERHVGLMAQDVLNVLPEAVEAKANGKFLGVNYNALIPLLIEAMHDLEDQLAQLHDEKDDASDKISELLATHQHLPHPQLEIGHREEDVDWAEREEEEEELHRVFAHDDAQCSKSNVMESLHELSREVTAVKEANARMIETVHQLSSSSHSSEKNSDVVHHTLIASSSSSGVPLTQHASLAAASTEEVQKEQTEQTGQKLGAPAGVWKPVRAIFKRWTSRSQPSILAAAA